MTLFDMNAGDLQMGASELQAKSVECIWEAKATLGEGVLYDYRQQWLIWLDIHGNKIFSLNVISGQKKTWEGQDSISAIGLNLEKDYLAVNRDGFHHLQLDWNAEKVKLQPISNPELDKPGNRFNDGKIDPFGGFWAGTLDNNELDDRAGSWWRLAPDKNVTVLDEGFHVTNGPAFSVAQNSPNEGDVEVYYTDSARRIVYKALFDPDRGITNKAEFLKFTSLLGYPDGMTCDHEGRLWIAFWDGGAVRCFSRTGELIQEIALPVPRPTSIVFINNTAYVTSARIGLDEIELRSAPLSGGLFKITLGTDFNHHQKDCGSISRN
jgi:sugar lactone lactonase YvrE